MHSILIQLRRLLISFLVGLLFLGGLGYFTPLTSEAAALTPEARDYQVDRDRVSVDPQQATAKAQEAGDDFVESLKNAADTVREKLNLDEPIPESTKTSLKQLRGEKVTPQESEFATAK
jgi:hypothetical protein